MQTRNCPKRGLALSLLLCLSPFLWASQDFVVHRGETICLRCDTTALEPVTRTAIAMWQEDVRQVLGAEVKVSMRPSRHRCIELQQSDALPREGFGLEVKRGRLTVSASDGHGLAYGLLELSRLLGVSPWTWWADLGYRPLEVWSLPEGYSKQEAPDVDFRGIFINDEDWGLMPWSSQTYEPLGVKGSIGPRTYSRVFELLLRLRANTIWPAMHECSEPFFLTPGNREAAARYGIYMGGSHCEPMACSAAVEWSRRGVGDYDYVNNSTEVRRFWKQRLDEVRDQEILYTLGMRGVHDGAMQGARTIEEQRQVLTRVLRDQREMLTSALTQGTSPRYADITKVPQVFIPYKEVLDVYNAGLEVPDDVCLMWCDDNYGYIRHFPTPAEQQRRGGNGIYYHCSYWGRPHDYLWLGSMSPYLMYQQLSKGYDHGIGRIWILNVGDIKPSEYQTELFMDMAWDMQRVKDLGVNRHMEQWYSRDFGADLGQEIQQVMAEWYRLAFERKPEHLGGTRVEEADRKYWSQLHDLDWSREQVSRRLADYEALSDRVETLWATIPEAQRDAFFQLVKYPVQGADQLNRKLLEAQRARHGEQDWAVCDAALDSIQRLTLRYNEGFSNHGKWRRMMDWQPRRLPVFGAVPHEADSTAWPSGREVVWQHDTWFTELPVGSKLTYRIEAAQLPPCDSLLLELHLLPSHPIDGEHQQLWLQVGEADPVLVDFRTQGRSEEWKLNVLSNDALRRFTLPRPDHDLTLSLWTEFEGVVVNQIVVREEK